MIHPANHHAASVIVAEALRMVQYWGLASVEAVVSRVRVLTAARAMASGLVVSVLGALAPLLWLDGADRNWFSLRGHDSGLETAVRKVFSVAARVNLPELKAALAKGLRGLSEAPDPVFQRYLTEILGCTVDGPLVRRGGPLREPVLTGPEASLARILDAAGGEMDVAALRRQARAESLERTTVRRLLEMSPLFLLGPGARVRLIGNALASAG